MATNYFQGLPVPKEIKDALASEVSDVDSGGGGAAGLSIRSLVDADGVPGTGPLTGFLVFEIFAEDLKSNVVWLKDTSNETKYAKLPASSKVGDRVRVLNLVPPGFTPAATVYVGVYPEPGVMLFQGASSFTPMQVPPGNGLTLTHIADNGLPVWEVVMDYTTTVPAHASTHNAGGSDPIAAL